MKCWSKKIKSQEIIVRQNDMKETEDIFEPKNEKEEVFLHPNDPFVEKHPKSHFRI